MAAVPEEDDVQVLQDAARVHAVSRDVHEAVAALAVRPLEEAAADRMRQVLAGEYHAAQASLRRLRLVTTTDEEPAE